MAASIVDLSWLEKLALRETGRLAIDRLSCQGRLHMYPATMVLRDLLSRSNPSSGIIDYYLETGDPTGSIIDRMRSSARYLKTLNRLIARCDYVDIYTINDGDFTLEALAALALARFMGRTVIHHDYGFAVGNRSRLARVINSLADCRILSDYCTEAGSIEKSPVTSVRIFSSDIDSYSAFSKEKAVPRVLIYGDYDRPSEISLAVKSYELVKEKYPRTEFALVSCSDIKTKSADLKAIQLIIPAGERELRSVFKECDILVLLSAGGLNRYFALRARRAGFPVITNGFDLLLTGKSETGLIRVTRDSYSGVADEIIRLVEDEGYYRSFAL